MGTNNIAPQSEVIEKAGPAHAYLPPNGALRSPCPCLNTMANYSYLPHDGRNITFRMLISALQDCMGLSRGFAVFMAIGTFVLLRRPSLAPFDLTDTARHDFIEHDASMAHVDARPGDEYAPCDVDLELLDEFLAKAHPSESRCNGGSVITAQDIAERRIEREAVSPPLDAVHAELGRAEFAMVVQILGMGEDKELDRTTLEVFLRENRMPDGWTPSHTVHLWEAVSRSASIRHAMNEIKGKAGKENARDHEGRVQEWFRSIVQKFVHHEA